jgi:hypothetical protein
VGRRNERGCVRCCGFCGASTELTLPDGGADRFPPRVSKPSSGSSSSVSLNDVLDGANIIVQGMSGLMGGVWIVRPISAIRIGREPRTNGSFWGQRP